MAHAEQGRSTRRVKIVAAVVAVVIVAAAGWKLYDAAGAKQRAVDDAALRAVERAAEQAFDITPANAPAPAIELGTMLGDRFSLAAAKGQVVFVNFWATWCPPCRQEMPSMVQLGRELETRYPGKFKMVAVSVDEGWQPVLSFLRAPPGIAVALDADQQTTKSYYCAARGGCPDAYLFPESYIVDKTGRLVAYVIGPRDWSDPAARRFLERLIKS